MKFYNNALVILFLAIAIIACKKSALDYVNEDIPATGGGVMLTKGNFMRSSHATSGTARIVKDSNDRRFLVFENFSTDNGPDLRVRLSKNTSAAQYQEVARLTAVAGNFSYELAANIDPTVYNHVLIWCEDFSVLFGYAILQ